MKTMDSNQFNLSNVPMDVFQKIIEKCDPLEIMMLMIVYGKNVDILRILRKIGNLRNVKCSHVAEKGYLSVLKWFRENNYPWEAATCAFAALNGHLDVLKWARANGCPWDELTCTQAALNGHLDVLKWARANGCPWDELTCTQAALNGHLDVLKWVRANGCSWSESNAHSRPKMVIWKS